MTFLQCGREKSHILAGAKPAPEGLANHCHQAAIVATDGTREMAGIAAAMLARWS